MNSIWIVIHKRFRKDTNPTDLGLPQKFSGNTIIHGNPVLYLRILPTKPIACSWATHRNQSKKSLPYFHALSESKVLTWGALLLRVTGPVTPWHMHQATEVLVCCCMKSSLAKIVWYKEMHLYTRTFHPLDDFYNFFPRLMWDQVRLILACGCHLAQWKFIESPESDFSCSVAKVT